MTYSFDAEQPSSSARSAPTDVIEAYPLPTIVAAVPAASVEPATSSVSSGESDSPQGPSPVPQGPELLQPAVAGQQTESSRPTPSPSSSQATHLVATKLELLEAVAPLNRGALAGQGARTRIEGLVASLERSGSGMAPFDGCPAPVEGRWELLYANTEVFRAR